MYEVVRRLPLLLPNNSLDSSRNSVWALPDAAREQGGIGQSSSHFDKKDKILAD
jgi:hypothetical protein